jgi:hypothetical protein
MLITRRKTKDTGDIDENGNPVQLIDVEKEGDGGIGDEGVPEANMADSEAIMKTAGSGAKKPKKGGKTKSKVESVKDEEMNGLVAVKMEEDTNSPPSPAPLEPMKAPKAARKGRKPKAEVVASAADNERPSGKDGVGASLIPAPRKRVRVKKE